MIDTAPAPAPRRPRSHRAAVATLGALTTVGLATGAAFGAEALTGGHTVVGQAYPAGDQWSWTDQGPGSGTGQRPDRSASGSGSSGTTGSATAAQAAGVVEIDSVLGYQRAEAAGTGMILTSDGEVLTNNHVVDGATSIRVTVASTGTTYQATVVGTDAADDVAVLQLQHASGLQTVSTRTAAAQVGESVTAVGNAGGTGSLTAAPGEVTATDRTITASDENGANPEQLTGLIETNAAVQAGDSGGPLYDSSGQVIGMDTAASGGRVADGYAIPITRALTIAQQIESRVDSGSITRGYPAFLGVSVQDADGGALVSGVASGGAAERAGLAAGDVITAVGGRPVTSADTLKSALAAHSPGDSVTVTWTDTSGAAHSARVTLGAGPAN